MTRTDKKHFCILLVLFEIALCGLVFVFTNNIDKTIHAIILLCIFDAFVLVYIFLQKSEEKGNQPLTLKNDVLTLYGLTTSTTINNVFLRTSLGYYLNEECDIEVFLSRDIIAYPEFYNRTFSEYSDIWNSRVDCIIEKDEHVCICLLDCNAEQLQKFIAKISCLP